MSDCIYTRAECHHKGCRCSECPITDLICDEFTDCLDLSYQQGRADAIEELLSKCEQYNYTCNSREFARIIREQLKENKNE